jgi:hypothetical protein
MGDLAVRGGMAAARPVPKGIAFAIADLVLAQSRAAFNDSRILVRLDHGAEDEEYEEVIALYTGRSSASRLIMWRSATVVVVQPILGRKQEFPSVAEALDSVFPRELTALSDILAIAWPID